MAEIDLSQAPRRVVGWTAFAAIVIGGTTLFVALAAFNANDLALVHDEEGGLRIQKGRFLPWGHTTFEPSPAFEPVHVPVHLLEASGVSLPLGACDDELACERRFYRALLVLAEAALRAETPEDLAVARELIVRAQLFPHITLAERAPIEDLTGGIHYVEALVVLEEVRRELELAHKKLERSRIAGMPLVEHAHREALIEMVESQLRLFDALPTTPQRDPAPDRPALPPPSGPPDEPPLGGPI